MTLKYACITVTPFAQNCTVLYCDDTLEGAIVDPGGEPERIIATVSELGIKVTGILLTHCHLDHVGAVADMVAHYDVPVTGPHQADEPLLSNLAIQAVRFGFPPPAPFTIDRWLTQGDEIVIGKRTLRVYHCPGHAPGHVIYVDEQARLAQTGDVLFQGSIGRTDLPGGDHGTLIRSIVETLWPLGDDLRFIPGHGAPSTLGEERRSNPFVGDHVLA
ncbi:MBL fold metallo-hydrolase [Larsenimonas rhizosphaerae]|uniref:MBL fold metallo-hydrolase n=1 Tax=Larsenimonas rhizosphaerae TaxID=2944682 RepID=A0AA42CX80_9GAMM|nr:MBL fold metallo-hydrolase [Larsenimonas rhizosphaerae]MCX2523568.1 MBL fold metallo-hydrolase [Larsenimonas rhizosphaerae]